MAIGGLVLLAALGLGMLYPNVGTCLLFGLLFLPAASSAFMPGVAEWMAPDFSTSREEE